MERQEGKVKGVRSLEMRTLSDNAYNPMCKLKFTMAVVRELAVGNVDSPDFSNDELNGLALVMEGALKELGGLLSGTEATA